MLGEGTDVLSCCKPTAAGSPYCDTHRKRMKGPPAPGYEDMLIELIRFIG